MPVLPDLAGGRLGSDLPVKGLLIEEQVSVLIEPAHLLVIHRPEGLSSADEFDDLLCVQRLRLRHFRGTPGCPAPSGLYVVSPSAAAGLRRDHCSAAEESLSHCRPQLPLAPRQESFPGKPNRAAGGKGDRSPSQLSLPP